METRITYAPLAAYDADAVVVHLKGFGSRLDYDDCEVNAAAEVLLDALRQMEAGALAWDGDDLAEDSFTKLVLRAAVELDLPLVAFKYASEVDAFHASWRNAKRSITCYVVDDAVGAGEKDRYAALGIAGLRATRAANALCLGGSSVTMHEMEASKSCTFRLFACGRPAAREPGGLAVRERPGMEGLVAANLLHAKVVRRWRPVAADVEADEGYTALKWYAVQCAAEDDGLFVAPSKISAAGLGLYTATARQRGDVLCEYRGTVLRTRAALRLGDKRYLMRLGPQCYVDSRPHLHVKARYVNDARKSGPSNVEFVKEPQLHRALVVATNAISAGDELYVSYGALYWLAHDVEERQARRAGTAPGGP
ncbi:hypothetical protein M885DRAFT_484165 [Pelagophyceae sp. CCMP2097]|nr:hypothetical protein M885DRAFT_484165 [Pelagophyceae sp. CCMP2097]